MAASTLGKKQNPPLAWERIAAEGGGGRRKGCREGDSTLGLHLAGPRKMNNRAWQMGPPRPKYGGGVGGNMQPRCSGKARSWACSPSQAFWLLLQGNQKTRRPSPVSATLGHSGKKAKNVGQAASLSGPGLSCGGGVFPSEGERHLRNKL